jgi:hypothetical protein
MNPSSRLSSRAKKLSTILEAPELALEAERAIIQVGEQLEAEAKVLPAL